VSAVTAPPASRLGVEARRCSQCRHRRIFHFEFPDNRSNPGTRASEQAVRCSIPGCPCAAYDTTSPASVNVN